MSTTAITIPTFEKAARLNARRVKLLEPLRLQLLEPLRLQLLELGDLILQQEAAALLDLDQRGAPDAPGAFAWGAGMGVIVGVAAAVVVWAL